MVCLGVGDDGLHGHDGLVDLGLQLPQLLDVQQAQDLRRLVQSGVCNATRRFYFYAPLTSGDASKNDQEISPPVSKPRMCFSKETGMPWGEENKM